MLSPETDAYAPVVRFSIPGRERRGAVAVAIGLVAVAVVLWLRWRVPPEVRTIVAAAVGVGALAAGLRAWRRENVELDVESGLYRRVSGWPPVAARQELPIVRPLHIFFTSSDGTSSADGRPERLYSAWLHSGESRLPLLRGWPERQAPEFLALLAERLGAQVAPAPSDGGRRWNPGAVIMWLGVASVFALMFWPILSGQRPLRPVWAAIFPNRGMSVSRDTFHFQEANRLYGERKFAEAERMFEQAISEGYSRAYGYNMIAYAQAGQKRMDAALETAKKALSHAPDSGFIMDTVGEMHELRHEYTEAVDYYQRALAHMEGNSPVETQTKLGRTLIALGRRKEAIPYLREAASQPAMQYGPLAASLLHDLGESVPYPEPPGARRRPTIRETY